MLVEKIMFMVPSIDSGGAERVVVNLANYSAQNGYKSTILVLNDSKQFYNLEPSVRTIILNKEKKSLGILSTVFTIRKVVKQVKPDVIITFLWYTGVWAVFSLLGTRISLITTVRNNPYIIPNSIVQRILRNISVFLSKGCIFQTKEASSYFPSFIQKRSAIIPNPITQELPTPWYGEREKLIVSVGRLEKQKDHETLIKAFSKILPEFPEYKLIIFGEGSLRYDLEELIVNLNLVRKVELPGARTDVLKHIVKASVFVLSSKYEGMPNSLLEAMAIGLPCISTNCPMGPDELINDGVNGLLIKVGDVDGMAAAIRKVLGTPKLAESISREGVKLKEKMDIQLVFERFSFYLKSL